MRYFNEHRRRLIKQNYIRGTKATVESNGATSVKLTDTTNLPLLALEVAGNTVQDGIPTLDAPVPVQNAGDNGVGITVGGINLFDARGKKEHSTYGIHVYGENNVFCINGKTTSPTVRGILYDMKNLKSNTVYTVRFKRLSGSAAKGGQVRLYHFKKNPVQYERMICYYSAEKLESNVATFSFTDEQIANGVSLGFYVCDMTEEAEFSDYTVRVDVVEGSYTSDTFPDYEQYVEPKAVSIDTELHGIDGYNDVLCLNYAKNTVEVKRRVYSVCVADLIDENSCLGSSEGAYDIGIKNLPKWETGTAAYCSHCDYYDGTRRLCFDLINDTYSATLYFYWIEQSTVSDFYNWAKENDVRIAYVTEETRIEDIDFQLPKEIFPYNATSVIETSGSGIDAIYYDLEK